MTPTHTRYGDHNRKNRELLEETKQLGGNPYYYKYLEQRSKKNGIINRLQKDNSGNMPTFDDVPESNDGVEAPVVEEETE